MPHPPIKIIKYKKTNTGWIFKIVVGPLDDQTTHRVTLSEDYYQALAEKTAPDQLVVKSFEFLLQREPKESILNSFDLKDISRYFPEYESKIKK